MTEKERNKGYEKYLSEKRVGKKSRKNLKGRKMTKKKEEIIKKKITRILKIFVKDCKKNRVKRKN